MLQAQKWIMKKQPWSGIAHHLSDFFAHFGFVTVDSAVSAHRFVIAKGAFADPLERIVKKSGAFSAEAALMSMASGAEHADHYPDRFLFLFAPVHARNHSFKFGHSDIIVQRYTVQRLV
jgi:hypothetical protein